MFMEKLFAAYLAQELVPTFMPGQYDPEQELWVADNQLQGSGVTPFATINETETETTHGTFSEKYVWTGFILDTVTDLDTKKVPDTDSGPDI
jgi:hypothetical protein